MVNDGWLFAGCDRLPYPLDCCPVCDAGFKPFRGVKKINTVALFDRHEGCKDTRPCPFCDGLLFNRPHVLDKEQNFVDVGDFLMCVGEKFYKTPADFTAEAINMGVSKKISSIPKNLVVGYSWVYLAHPAACKKVVPPCEQPDNGELVKAPKTVDQLGIFTFFIPTRIEMPVWKGKTSAKKRKQLEKRGITLVEFDYDPDYDPKAKTKKKGERVNG